MHHGALEFRQRALRALALCAATAALTFGSSLTSCSSLPSASCAPCRSSCPDRLECIDGRCVVRGHEDECPAPDSSASSDGATLSGTGGGAGESSGESSGTAGDPGLPPVSDSGGAAGCAAEPSPCTPQFITPRVLPAVCSGASIEVKLAAGCECDDAEAFHSVTWSSDELPSGVTLEPTGSLSGELPAGTHQLRLAAQVDGKRIADEFEITVLDRCLLFFATSEPTTGRTILAAARIDTGEPVMLDPDAPSEGDLVRFDLSPDGRFLAEVQNIEGRQECRLFTLGATEAEPLALEHDGDYLEHAFSRDSRWLALVTTPAADEARRQLELIDLHGDPGAVIDVKEVEYQGGLSWSDAGGLLYREAWSENALYFTARERAVSPGGFGLEEEYVDTREMNDNQFYRFFVSDAGFMMLYQSSLPYFDRETGDVLRHPPVQSLSPDLRWVAQLDSKGVWVTPVATPSHLATRRDGCDVVRAWSRDGSQLLCTLNHQLLAYDVAADGTLDLTELTGILDGDVRRAAFSDGGRWLALTPSKAGFVLLSKPEFATKPLDQPTLAPPAGKNEWDYFFTPDETRLVVQRGRDLLVAALGDKTSVTSEDFHEIGVRLREVPFCNPGWFPDPEQWCGAPRWRGNLRLSPAERHVAFVDLEGVVNVAALDTLRTVSAGPTSDLASSDSFVFQ